MCAESGSDNNTDCSREERVGLSVGVLQQSHSFSLSVVPASGCGHWCSGGIWMMSVKEKERGTGSEGKKELQTVSEEPTAPSVIHISLSENQAYGKVTVN